MNITLSVDEKVVERAREIARQQGTSLNALIREYIEQLAGLTTGEELWRQIQRDWAEVDTIRDSGSSRGYRFDRDEIYQERLGRNRGGDG